MMNVVTSRVMVEGKPHTMMSVVYPTGECDGKELMNLMIDAAVSMMDNDGCGDMANCLREMDNEERALLVKAAIESIFEEGE